MHPPRIYAAITLVPGTAQVLDDAASSHVTRVLRLRVGDPIIAFDGSGSEYPATIMSTGKRQVGISTGTGHRVDRESPLAITLWQGLSRSQRMDMVIQKATELGVRAIQPVVTQRSVVRLDEARSASRVVHWQRIAINACEQCGRTIPPVVHAPLPLDAALAAHPASGLALLLDPGSTDSHVLRTPVPAPVTLAIGPEGGFCPAEQAALRDAGFRSLCLGPRILRTETAPLVALSILQYVAGDLRPA